MSGCLGNVLAALVDGELDHAAREKAHRHLAHCGLCRAEVEAQRRLKAHLSRTGPAEPSSALLARLHALPGTAPAATASPATGVPAPSPAAPALPVPAVRAPVLGAAASRPSLLARSRTGIRPARALLPVLVRAPTAGGLPARPAVGRPAARPVSASRRPAGLSRRGVAGSAFAVLGVAAALALGAPPQRAVPATPGSGPAVLVTEVATTGTAPPTGLVGAGLAPVTSRVTAAQVVRRPEVPVRAATGTAVARSGR